MCGIIAGVGDSDISQLLLMGLKRLEYRGYDSAGMSVQLPDGAIKRLRLVGKVAALAHAMAESPLPGHIGLAHTRWATHGKPTELNAHPHQAKGFSLVHNGIIENHETIRAELQSTGVVFESETDTEVVAQALAAANLAPQAALETLIPKLHGAYALAMMHADSPGTLWAVRVGSPLIVGFGDKGHFVASDPIAVLPFCEGFVVLDEGDMVKLTAAKMTIFDKQGEVVTREQQAFSWAPQAIEKGHYRHFMQKEIFEQPTAVQAALAGRLQSNDIADQVFGPDAGLVFDQTQAVQLIACGTSYHAASVCQHWLESKVRLFARADVASQYRAYRPMIWPNTLMVALSQSGETADTLGALRDYQDQGYLSQLAICNVAESTLVRETNQAILTHAGPEIGVASTKAFTTQLVSLLMLVYCLGRRQGLRRAELDGITAALAELPGIIKEVLKLDEAIEVAAQSFSEVKHALFLGRGEYYPIAQEGALKLKEISYIHAEAYPAGELKHGPLALVEKGMPIVVIAPNDERLAKLKANIEEVKARGGVMWVFTEEGAEFEVADNVRVFKLPQMSEWIRPIVYSIPLQLLAYHVAVVKGTDVDQPRNLAKSVTVE